MVTGSSILAPMANAGVGVVGPEHQSTFSKAARKSSVIRRRTLLRLQIIGIEIAGRQHVGAGHDAALDLGAESLAARALVQVDEILRALAAVAVAHAIVAREVRRALGGRHHVVHRHRQRQVRQAHLDCFAAERVNLERLAHAAARSAARAPSKNSLSSPILKPATGSLRLRRNPAPAHRRWSSRSDRSRP